MAHKIAAECIVVDKGNNLVTIKDPLDVYPKIDEETEEAISQYIKYVSDYGSRPGVKSYVETRFKYDENLWGTADFIAYDPAAGEIFVCDFKFGQGVFVSANNNLQLLIYAFLFINEKRGGMPPNAFKLSIVQPRHHSEKKIREWKPDIFTAIGTWAYILKAMKNIEATNPPRIPGPHCQFCKGQNKCPEFAELAMSAYYPDKEALAQVIHPEMDVNDTSEKLKKLPQIKLFIKMLEEQALAMALAGKRIPEYKLVERRTRARIDDLPAAMEYLMSCGLVYDDIHESKLLSVTHLKKKIAGCNVDKTEKAKFTEFLTNPTGEPTLVHEDDKRPEVSANPTVEEAFGDLTK